MMHDVRNLILFSEEIMPKLLDIMHVITMNSFRCNL